jgi:hypothetical protein
MPILHAAVQTDRAARYVVQFGKHAAAMGGGGHAARIHKHATAARGEVAVAAEWSETDATVTFLSWGRCTLAVDGGTLTVRIDAADEHGLVRIREIVDGDLKRFGGRDPITVNWQRIEP